MNILANLAGRKVGVGYNEDGFAEILGQREWMMRSDDDAPESFPSG